MKASGMIRGNSTPQPGRADETGREKTEINAGYVYHDVALCECVYNNLLQENKFLKTCSTILRKSKLFSGQRKTVAAIRNIVSGLAK